jgi:RimJ/RimL family protein N-acetyltransferase
MSDGHTDVNVRLVELGRDALAALAAGDLSTAAVVLGLSLPDSVRDDGWLWRMRHLQVEEHAEDLAWIARLMVDASTGEVVGHAGFHGAPQDGCAEVAYAVFPDHRGRGFARAALRQLIELAHQRGVSVVRATVSPANEASLRVLAGFRFEVTGEQWDEEDGLEVVHELTLHPREGAMSPHVE